MTSRCPAYLALLRVRLHEGEKRVTFLLERGLRALRDAAERLDHQYRGGPLSFRLPRAGNHAVHEKRCAHLQILERDTAAMRVLHDPRAVVVREDEVVEGRNETNGHL